MDKRKLYSGVFQGLHSMFRWAFVCPDGSAYASQTRPRSTGTGWILPVSETTCWLGDDFDAAGWKDSLIERREEVRRFHGCKVPRFVDNDLAGCVERFNDGACSCLAVSESHGAADSCTGIDCADCILSCCPKERVPSTSEYKSMQAFSEYARKAGYMITRTGFDGTVPPELCPGQVVKADSRYYLMVSELHGYRLTYEGFNTQLGVYTAITPDDVEEVFSVWDTKAPDATIYRIITGREDAQKRTSIWRRAEVAEMTVDEISEKLGYPVKVVGEHK